MRVAHRLKRYWSQAVGVTVTLVCAALIPPVVPAQMQAGGISETQSVIEGPFQSPPVTPFVVQQDLSSDFERAKTVQWGQIVGILRATTGMTVGGFDGDIASWTAQWGRAVVDLSSGKTKFQVKGLVLAHQPVLHPTPEPVLTPTPIIGTTGLVTQVKGTLVCDASRVTPLLAPSSFVDTPAVPLTAQGNAEFEGVMAIPFACLETPRRLAFLIRPVDLEPLPFEKWIAHGAVRRP